MNKIVVGFISLVVLAACKSGNGNTAQADTNSGTEIVEVSKLKFDADSAYSYVERQVAFGPRVVNTPAHESAGKWLVEELKRHGAVVSEQKTTLTAFNGTKLNATNILGKYNPDATERVLLVAHWDCRPWADADADPRNHTKPVDGANDGASGVGVLLEIARQLSTVTPTRGVDILFVDAEDYGSHDDDDSWALGARYFAENMPEGYVPTEVILLDMVGGQNAKFHKEYFSEQYAPQLNTAIWTMADASGYGSVFVQSMGGGITDDHLEFIKQGIPAIDIIEYSPGETGFNSRWHTVNDTMDGIDRNSLKAVGQTVLNYVLRE